MEQRQSPSGPRVGLITTFTNNIASAGSVPGTIAAGNEGVIARFEDNTGTGKLVGPLGVVGYVAPVFKTATAGEVGILRIDAIDVQSGLVIDTETLGSVWAPADDEFGGQTLSFGSNLPAGHIYRIDFVFEAALTTDFSWVARAGRIWGYR